MKKLYYLFITLFLLLIPIYVNAEDNTIIIDNIDINIVWNKENNDLEVKETYTINNDYDNIHLEIAKPYTNTTTSFSTNFIYDDERYDSIHLYNMNKGEYYITYKIESYNKEDCYTMTSLTSRDTHQLIINNVSYQAIEKNEQVLNNKLYAYTNSDFITDDNDILLSGKSIEPKDNFSLKICGIQEYGMSTSSNLTQSILIAIIRTILSIIAGIAVIFINRSLIKKYETAHYDEKKKNLKVFGMCLILYITGSLFSFLTMILIPLMIWVFYYFMLFADKDSKMGNGRKPAMIFLYFFSGANPILYILLMISLDDILDYYHGISTIPKPMYNKFYMDPNHVNEVKHSLSMYTRSTIVLALIISSFFGVIALSSMEVFLSDNQLTNFLYIIFPILLFIVICTVRLYKNRRIINMLTNKEIKGAIDVDNYTSSNVEILSRKYTIFYTRIGKKTYSSYPYFGDTHGTKLRLLVFDEEKGKYLLDVYDQLEKDVTN